MIEIKEKKFKVSLKALMSITVFFLVACNSSPTVPLPPPEAVSSSAPDEYGFVWVTGEYEEAVEGDIALVYNENRETGSMSEIMDDGTFGVEVEADTGDTLIVQVLHEGELSEEVVITVPSD